MYSPIKQNDRGFSFWGPIAGRGKVGGLGLAAATAAGSSKTNFTRAEELVFGQPF